MSDMYRLIKPTLTTALASLLLLLTACDPSTDPAAVQLEDSGQLPVAPADARLRAGSTIPEIASESAERLLAAADPAVKAKGKCKLDTFQFRLPEDAIAIATPPGGFFTPFPHGIPTFDDPILQDSYIFVITMRDLANNIVGYASEQEVVDLVVNESKTSYTLTLPGRGTLMLAQLESFQVLIDAVDDMIADGVLVRTFDPPLVEVLTIPGTGKVVGGSEEFNKAKGIMQEIGVVYEIDLVNNAFELGIIVQALHC